jgi:hypothetical protein
MLSVVEARRFGAGTAAARGTARRREKFAIDLPTRRFRHRFPIGREESSALVKRTFLTAAVGRGSKARSKFSIALFLF